MGVLVSHRRPTEEAYAELQAAYDFYNDHLFASQERLPACLITYQREKRTMGYFSQARFIRRDGIKADEIAMNPDYFAVIPWSRSCRRWSMKWCTSGNTILGSQVEPATTTPSGLTKWKLWA